MKNYNKAKDLALKANEYCNEIYGQKSLDSVKCLLMMT
jgi:hypothetical protein